ncbi:MAG: hypothetical protein II238_04785 [Alphaproteobacteria bacterium]|nr:hypothetical protein [Alphaproteobacteria bacterium]
MNKIHLVILANILLTGCIEPTLYPYEGTQTIKGEGGFVYFRELIDSETLADKEYKYDMVSVYISGLPVDKDCELIGLVVSDNMQELIDLTLELEGNVLTKSGVSFPITFDKNGGILENSLKPTTEIIKSGDFSLPIYRYNAFECK